MTSALYVGIDVGIGGGIASITDQGDVVLAVNMPTSDHDFLAVLQVRDLNVPVRAALEHVSSSPQMGVTSAFSFGREFGRCRMALAAAAIPFDLVHPKVWQRRLGCLSAGDKNITKARAQQLFPRQKVTHAIADALLLAEYCRRVHGAAPERVGIRTYDDAPIIIERRWGK